MKRMFASVGFLVLIMVTVVLATVTADVRHREDGVPGYVISQRIRARMELRRQERAPRLTSATRLPGAGPGYESISINGQMRTFVRYTPDSVLLARKRAPVVFLLHGAGGVAAHLAPYVGLNAVADREHFIVVYPQGIEKVWNDGRDPGDKASHKRGSEDDAAFLNLLADGLVADGVADPERIYLAGISNGGFMALNLACNPDSRFAAIASVIASLPEKAKPACTPRRAVPVLMINGTADPLVHYDGSASNTGIKGNLPVPATAQFFAELNQCGTATELSIDPRDTSDETRVSQRVWHGCRDGSGVALYTISGGGHQAPSTAKVTGGIVIDWAMGIRSRQIDTAETVWDFFKAHKR